MQKSNPAFCSQLYSTIQRDSKLVKASFIPYMSKFKNGTLGNMRTPFVIWKNYYPRSQNLTNWKRSNLTHYKAILCVLCLGGLRWEGDNVHCGWSALQQHLQCSGKGLQQDRGQPLQQDIDPADFRG